jgi:hypothetical protein
VLSVKQELELKVKYSDLLSLHAFILNLIKHGYLCNHREIRVNTLCIYSIHIRISTVNMCEDDTW